MTNEQPPQGKFVYESGDLEFSACVYCKHKQRGAVCAAFPDGIPDEILDMENDHSEPFEGDGGI